MNVIWFPLPGGWVFELAGFYFIRDFKDGVSFFEFNINLDLFDMEPNPKFSIHLLFLNINLLEISIYREST